MNTGSRATLLLLLALAGCKPGPDAISQIKVEDVNGVAHLSNTSKARAIRATYSCGGYTSQTITLQPGQRAISDLGNNTHCSRAVVTSARYLDGTP